MAREPLKRKRCPSQHKICFSTRAQAIRFCQRVGFVRYYTYECPSCGKWHFTTRYANRKEEL